jgi:hypothetical protein
LKANPRLARLINRAVGDEWITNLTHLRGLESWADDTGFQDEFRQIKHANKERLARVIRDATGIEVDPASLFDAQVKRIHEYKRQLLNVLHIIFPGVWLRLTLKWGTRAEWQVCPFMPNALPALHLEDTHQPFLYLRGPANLL